MNDQRCSAVLPTTRLDTRLTQSRAGGQWPYLRSFDHLGRRSEAKYRKKKNLNKKTKSDARRPRNFGRIVKILLNVLGESPKFS